MLPWPWSVPALPFSRDPAAELGHRHHSDVVELRAEVGGECAERAGEIVEVVAHLAAVDVAEVGVHVPAAEVDGRHPQADLRLDQPGDVAQLVGEAAAGIGRDRLCTRVGDLAAPR